MKRLQDELDPNDPQQAHAAVLLGAGGPLRESEVSRERVLRAMKRSPAASRWDRLRPALAVALLFGLVGTAGATWGTFRWLSPAKDEKPTNDDEQNSKREKRNERHAADIQSGAVPEPKTADEAATPATSSEKPPTAKLTGDDEESARPPQHKASGTPSADSPKSTVDRTGATESKESAAVPMTAGDLVLLHQATEALRSSDDPEKAARLLREYERTRKSGALDEEALALSIEAALANKDPKVTQLAQSYLARYPKGRFRALAQQAVVGKK